MNDCKLAMSVDNGRINLQVSGTGMLELASMAGYLQVFVGQEAMKCGAEYDDAVLKLLDIHLAAMEELKKLARQDGGPGGADNG